MMTMSKVLLSGFVGFVAVVDAIVTEDSVDVFG